MPTDKALPAQRLNLPMRQVQYQFRAQNRCQSGLKNRAEIGKTFDLFWSVDFSPVLGGDLNPPLGLYFPLLSVSFAREFPPGWKTTESSGNKIVVFLSSVYLQSFDMFWPLSAFHGD
jgi:hypothetical protein